MDYELKQNILEYLDLRGKTKDELENALGDISKLGAINSLGIEEFKGIEGVNDFFRNNEDEILQFLMEHDKEFKGIDSTVDIVFAYVATNELEFLMNKEDLASELWTEEPFGVIGEKKFPYGQLFQAKTDENGFTKVYGSHYNTPVNFAMLEDLVKQKKNSKIVYNVTEKHEAWPTIGLSPNFMNVVNTDASPRELLALGEDLWGRPTFKDRKTNKMYAEVDGVLHTVTNDGEPESRAYIEYNIIPNRNESFVMDVSMSNTAMQPKHSKKRTCKP